MSRTVAVPSKSHTTARSVTAALVRGRVGRAQADLAPGAAAPEVRLCVCAFALAAVGLDFLPDEPDRRRAVPGSGPEERRAGAVRALHRDRHRALRAPGRGREDDR